MAKSITPSLAAASAWRKRLDLRLSLAMLAIVLFGAALRLYGLDRTSLWNDETISWFEARQPFWGMIQATAHDNALPLYHVILYAVIQLFGDSEIALRLPSVVFAIANIYLLYRLGTVFWDRLTGLFAAALLAFSGFHLWYSQEARMYSLLALAATAFALATVQFLSRPHWLRAALCTVAGMALLYSHLYGIFVWAGINTAAVVVLLRDEKWVAVDGRRWVAANGLAALGFLPWVPVLLGQVHRTIEKFWVPFPTPRFVYHMSVSIAGGAAMLGCLVLLSLLSFFPALVQRTDESSGPPAPRPVWHSSLAFELGWQKIILLSWGLVPFLIGYAISISGRPILFDRYLIGSLPALIVLAARGLQVLCFNRLVLAGAFVVLLASTIPALYGNLTTKMREDHRAAVAAFAGRFRSTDEVVFLSPGVYRSFHYYFRAPVMREVVIDDSTIDVDLRDAPRIWIFVRLKAADQLAQLLERVDISYLREQEFHFYGVATYLYVRRPHST